MESSLFRFSASYLTKHKCFKRHESTGLLKSCADCAPRNRIGDLAKRRVTQGIVQANPRDCVSQSLDCATSQLGAV